MFSRDRKIILVILTLLALLVTGCPPAECTPAPGITFAPPLAELKPAVEPPVGPVITFPDPNLEAAVRQALEEPYRDIHRSDLERFIVFHPSHREISNLAGLEWAINLERLDLHGNRIKDMSPLANLVNLNSLFLSRNQIRDITPLANLINLEMLWLHGNQISDISPLSNLTNLKHLQLGSGVAGLTNEITDISPLANLINLETLWLCGNRIRDIGPLSRLINLHDLGLRRNEISDLSPLVQNRGLGPGAEVWIAGNPLSRDSINIYIPQLQERGIRVCLRW